MPSENTVLAKVDTEPIESCPCNLMVRSDQKSTGNANHWILRFEYEDENGNPDFILFGGGNPTDFYTITNQDKVIQFTTNPGTEIKIATIGWLNSPGFLPYVEVEVECYGEYVPQNYQRYSYMHDGTDFDFEDSVIRDAINGKCTTNGFKIYEFE